jgi:BirA family transcriptional regulator, biotin operon repressor / biotin---[acetyl-CoA-carboxylase] ligase
MFFTFLPNSFINICSYHHCSIDSTNSWAKEQRDGFGQKELSVITADLQTKGKGRQGKPWLSNEKQNSCLSFAFFWPKENLQPFYFSQIASLCLLELLQKHGIECQIKWPNDLLAGGKKISGILVEIEPLENTGYIIVGCGLNVNMPSKDLESLPKKATSMLAETGRHFNIQALQAELAALFVKKLQEAEKDGFEQIKTLWHQKVQWMVSQHAIVQTFSTKAEGFIAEITPEGNLFLEIAPGEIIPVHSGEVFC